MYKGTIRSPVVVILLSIVTCGIYYLYWMYSCAVDVNRVFDEERINPVLWILLSLLFPPLSFYMLWQLDTNLKKIADAEDVPYKENFIMWLILALVCGVGVYVAMYQLQDGFNRVWTKRSVEY